jgi:hypothetical protein
VGRPYLRNYITLVYLQEDMVSEGSDFLKISLTDKRI